jgi:hypothetical protein
MQTKKDLKKAIKKSKHIYAYVVLGPNSDTKLKISKTQANKLLAAFNDTEEVTFQTVTHMDGWEEDTLIIN